MDTACCRSGSTIGRAHVLKEANSKTAHTREITAHADQTQRNRSNVSTRQSKTTTTIAGAPSPVKSAVASRPPRAKQKPKRLKRKESRRLQRMSSMRLYMEMKTKAKMRRWNRVGRDGLAECEHVDLLMEQDLQYHVPLRSSLEVYLACCLLALECRYPSKSIVGVDLCMR
jgi:hypothetical protein